MRLEILTVQMEFILELKEELTGYEHDLLKTTRNLKLVLTRGSYQVMLAYNSTTFS